MDAALESEVPPSQLLINNYIEADDDDSLTADSAAPSPSSPAAKQPQAKRSTCRRQPFIFTAILLVTALAATTVGTTLQLIHRAKNVNPARMFHSMHVSLMEDGSAHVNATVHLPPLSAVHSLHLGSVSCEAQFEGQTFVALQTTVIGKLPLRGAPASSTPAAFGVVAQPPDFLALERLRQRWHHPGVNPASLDVQLVCQIPSTVHLYTFIPVSWTTPISIPLSSSLHSLVNHVTRGARSAMHDDAGLQVSVAARGLPQLHLPAMPLPFLRTIGAYVPNLQITIPPTRLALWAPLKEEGSSDTAARMEAWGGGHDPLLDTTPETGTVLLAAGVEQYTCLHLLAAGQPQATQVNVQLWIDLVPTGLDATLDDAIDQRAIMAALTYSIKLLTQRGPLALVVRSPDPTYHWVSWALGGASIRSSHQISAQEDSQDDFWRPDEEEEPAVRSDSDDLLHWEGQPNATTTQRLEKSSFYWDVRNRQGAVLGGMTYVVLRACTAPHKLNVSLSAVFNNASVLQSNLLWSLDRKNEVFKTQAWALAPTLPTGWPSQLNASLDAPWSPEAGFVNASGHALLQRANLHEPIFDGTLAAEVALDGHHIDLLVSGYVEEQGQVLSTRLIVENTDTHANVSLAVSTPKPLKYFSCNGTAVFLNGGAPASTIGSWDATPRYSLQVDYVANVTGLCTPKPTASTPLSTGHFLTAVQLNQSSGHGQISSLMTVNYPSYPSLQTLDRVFFNGSLPFAYATNALADQALASAGSSMPTASITGGHGGTGPAFSAGPLITLWVHNHTFANLHPTSDAGHFVFDSLQASFQSQHVSLQLYNLSATYLLNTPSSGGFDFVTKPDNGSVKIFFLSSSPGRRVYDHLDTEMNVSWQQAANGQGLAGVYSSRSYYGWRLNTPFASNFTAVSNGGWNYSSTAANSDGSHGSLAQPCQSPANEDDTGIMHTPTTCAGQAPVADTEPWLLSVSIDQLSYARHYLQSIGYYNPNYPLYKTIHKDTIEMKGVQLTAGADQLKLQVADSSRITFVHDLRGNPGISDLITYNKTMAGYIAYESRQLTSAWNYGNHRSLMTLNGTAVLNLGWLSAPGTRLYGLSLQTQAANPRYLKQVFYDYRYPVISLAFNTNLSAAVTKNESHSAVILKAATNGQWRFVAGAHDMFYPNVSLREKDVSLTIAWQGQLDINKSSNAMQGSTRPALASAAAPFTLDMAPLTVLCHSNVISVKATIPERQPWLQPMPLVTSNTTAPTFVSVTAGGLLVQARSPSSWLVNVTQWQVGVSTNTSSQLTADATVMAGNASLSMDHRQVRLWMDSTSREKPHTKPQSLRQPEVPAASAPLPTPQPFVKSNIIVDFGSRLAPALTLYRIFSNISYHRFAQEAPFHFIISSSDVVLALNETARAVAWLSRATYTSNLAHDFDFDKATNLSVLIEGLIQQGHHSLWVDFQPLDVSFNQQRRPVRAGQSTLSSGAVDLHLHMQGFGFTSEPRLVSLHLDSLTFEPYFMAPLSLGFDGQVVPDQQQVVATAMLQGPADLFNFTCAVNMTIDTGRTVPDTNISVYGGQLLAIGTVEADYEFDQYALNATVYTWLDDGNDTGLFHADMQFDVASEQATFVIVTAEAPFIYGKSVNKTWSAAGELPTVVISPVYIEASEYPDGGSARRLKVFAPTNDDDGGGSEQISIASVALWFRNDHVGVLADGFCEQNKEPLYDYVLHLTLRDQRYNLTTYLQPVGYDNLTQAASVIVDAGHPLDEDTFAYGVEFNMSYPMTDLYFTYDGQGGVGGEFRTILTSNNASGHIRARADYTIKDETVSDQDVFKKKDLNGHLPLQIRWTAADFGVDFGPALMSQVSFREKFFPGPSTLSSTVWELQRASLRGTTIGSWLVMFVENMQMSSNQIRNDDFTGRETTENTTVSFKNASLSYESGQFLGFVRRLRSTCFTAKQDTYSDVQNQTQTWNVDTQEPVKISWLTAAEDASNAVAVVLEAGPWTVSRTYLQDDVLADDGAVVMQGLRAAAGSDNVSVSLNQLNLSAITGYTSKSHMAINGNMLADWRHHNYTGAAVVVGSNTVLDQLNAHGWLHTHLGPKHDGFQLFVQETNSGSQFNGLNVDWTGRLRSDAWEVALLNSSLQVSSISGAQPDLAREEWTNVQDLEIVFRFPPELLLNVSGVGTFGGYFVNSTGVTLLEPADYDAGGVCRRFNTTSTSTSTTTSTTTSRQPPVVRFYLELAFDACNASQIRQATIDVLHHLGISLDNVLQILVEPGSIVVTTEFLRQADADTLTQAVRDGRVVIDGAVAHLQPAKQSKHGGQHIAAIVAAGGAVAFVALVAVIALVYTRRWRRSRQAGYKAVPMDSNPSFAEDGSSA